MNRFDLDFLNWTVKLSWFISAEIDIRTLDQVGTSRTDYLKGKTDLMITRSLLIQISEMNLCTGLMTMFSEIMQ